MAVLLERYGDLVASRADLSVRLRYCREAGMFPANLSKKRPQLEVVHLTTVFLASLTLGPQNETPEVVKQLWHLPLWNSTGQNVPAAFEYLTFGQVLAVAIDEYARKNTWNRHFNVSAFNAVSITRDFPTATILLHDNHSLKYDSLADISDILRPHRPRFIASMSTSFYAVEVLSGSLIQCRQAARRLGIQVATADACASLGLLPSAEGFPAGVPAIDPAWTMLNRSENETAAALPGATAAERPSLPGEAIANRKHKAPRAGSKPNDTRSGPLDQPEQKRENATARRHRPTA